MQVTRIMSRITLKKWFYACAVAVILLPIVSFGILMALYNGRFAPSYNSPFTEQLPLLVLIGAQLLVYLGLLVTSSLLALKVVPVWKRFVLGFVALLALLFTVRTVNGVVSYLTMIS